MLALHEGPPELTYKKVGWLMGLSSWTVGDAIRKARLEREWDERAEARKNDRPRTSLGSRI